jgi:hypothetical protein
MTKKRLLLVMPVLVTVFLLLWWALTEKYSSYHSWYGYPALVTMPLVLIWHLGLIMGNKPRIPLVGYAVVHLVVFTPIWFYCLMQLTHDSL